MSRKASATPAERHPIESTAYRLRQWPQVPDRFRTAPVLRAFSRMTLGPVTGKWFIQHTALSVADAAELLAEVEQQRAVDSMPFDVGIPAEASAGKQAPRAGRLPLRELVVAALFCWALAAPGVDSAPACNLADLLAGVAAASAGS